MQGRKRVFPIRFGQVGPVLLFDEKTVLGQQAHDARDGLGKQGLLPSDGGGRRLRRRNLEILDVKTTPLTTHSILAKHTKSHSHIRRGEGYKGPIGLGKS